MMNVILAALRSLSVPSEQDRTNAYLSEAVSLYDLERREMEVQRGKFRMTRAAWI